MRASVWVGGCLLAIYRISTVESAISLEYHAAVQHNTHSDSIIQTPSRLARMMIDDWVRGMREQDGDMGALGREIGYRG
jgi:hypothetical protein